MQELVKYLVSQLVQNKEEVEIQTVEEENATVITALVNNADLGRVIGHNGKVANSIRTSVNIDKIVKSDTFFSFIISARGNKTIAD